MRPKIFKPPHADRPAQESIADRLSWQPTQTFLHYAVVTILSGSLCYGVVIFFLMPQYGTLAWGQVVMSAVALVGDWLLRRKRPQAAVIFMASGIWVTITGIALFYDGVRTPIYYGYPILIIFLGWAVSTRAALFTVALTSATTLGFILADSLGWRTDGIPTPALLHGIVQIFVLVLSAALVIYLVQAYREQLKQMERASDEIAHANEVLRQSELKFATAFASSPVAAAIVTVEEGLALAVNDNFERDFGWTRTEMEGHRVQEVGLWQDLQFRQQWTDTLRRQGRTLNFETVWRHKDGAPRHVSMAGEIMALDGVPCILAYITDITERKAAEEQIQRLAFFDPLTNLPNRRLMMDRLDQAMAACARHRRQGALLFIDLDNFKTINDTHGHDKGDLLLKEVGTRLMGCVRAGDTVARLGGDEFVVMLEDLSGNATEAAPQAEAVGRKIMAALDESYEIQPLSLHSTPSMGITLFGAERENIEEPIKRADMAMYQAKAAGRNTIRFYDPNMQAVVAARVTMEHDLRLGLQLNQFVLYYQPQVQHGSRVTGVEALVRWLLPERGLVPPGQFIALAEETGLIVPLGEHVLDMACEQLARWAGQPGMAHLTLSVNVSPRQFQQENFVAQVLGALERTQAPARRLKLEITESLLIANVDEVIAKMAALKTHGVGFSLDDFGTGYSSLSYLKRLPLDQLKIDQGFVRDILIDANDAAIARMVIVLAESLGLEVIAEGVETVEQQQALLTQGCQAYQGYLYSRPLPLQDFERLAQQTDWPVMTPAA